MTGELHEHRTAGEARFRALFENAPDITAILDVDGAIVEVSDSIAERLGYEPERLIGRELDFVDPDDKASVRAFLAAVVAGSGATAGAVFRARTASGGRLLLEPVGIDLLDDPDVRGLVVTFRDVTRRRDLELRERQAERLESVGRLAGTLAHDFNNLLFVIRGYCEILGAALADSPLRSDVDEIAGAADHAAELTRQLLAFAQRRARDPVLLDVGDVVRGAEPRLRRSIPENIELSLELDPDVPPAVADAEQLEQVVRHLVVNSGDAMPRGGRVAISVASAVVGPGACLSPPVQPGPYVALSVVDSGGGIEEGALPHVFEPFFTTKESGVGAGLGLSTVYGIVTQSGGGIEVAAPPGGGTRMTVYLPAADVAAPSLPIGRPGEMILLVDDEDPVRNLVERVLADAGYDVLAAARPSEAQVLASAADVDLLLTDVVMPEMSGYDLAQRVKLSHPRAKALYMSGYAHGALSEAGSTPGGELLRKPFSPDQLIRAVRAVLDGRAVESA